MAYFGTYQAEPIRAKIVPNEGIYLCKIGDITFGKTNDGAEYTRIDCVINSDGFPHVSIFLTDGESFNSMATAFYDTFEIQRGNQDVESWKGKHGYLDIRFKMKDGFKNMIPYFIKDSEGWVIGPDGKRKVNQVQAASQMYGMPPAAEKAQESYGGESQNFPDDILF